MPTSCGLPLCTPSNIWVRLFSTGAWCKQRDLMPWQGIRDAVPGDAEGVAALLAPLEDAGILKPRTRQALLAELEWYAPSRAEPNSLFSP